MCINESRCRASRTFFRLSLFSEGEGRVRVSVANPAMQNTPHLSPLPSTEGRGETWIFREAHARRQHAIIVIIISILAIAARLILSDQPYVDRWSWRQSDVTAIARIFCKTDFVSVIRKLIGRAMRRVTSEPSFQFCPSSRRFATSLRVCTNGLGEFRLSFCSRCRCHFSSCSSGRFSPARRPLEGLSSMVLRH